MSKHGKSYTNAQEKIDQSKEYNLPEAIGLIKEVSYAKFDESIEVSVKLGVDPKHADQMVRGSVVLPHGIGKTQRVVVFAKGEKVSEARDAGADDVGADDLAEKIQSGWMEFDRVVATPDVMNIVGKLGRVLGPRGLMPNPKSGSVSFDVGRMVKEIKAGKVEYRVDKEGIVHALVGKMSFEVDALAENISVLTDTLVRAKPASSKGIYFKALTVSSTMGPGVKIDHQALIATIQ
ncbi:MAG: 50S ribosomal protein L1 [Woeseia sp.]|nr:50S ribosomal protein L1 [Woeseia sp.]|tara:strand:- start:1270 stop:1974 length:705 start_codon:yes stop_codon:yes gene_type:complete